MRLVRSLGGKRLNATSTPVIITRRRCCSLSNSSMVCMHAHRWRRKNTQTVRPVGPNDCAIVLGGFYLKLVNTPILFFVEVDLLPGMWCPPPHIRGCNSKDAVSFRP